MVSTYNMKKTLSFLVGGLLLTKSAFAGDITLAWDPTQDMNVTGFKVMYGVVGLAMTNVWPAGNATSVITTVPNLVSATNVTYRFAVVATNLVGTDSAPSFQLMSIITPHTVKKTRFVGRTANGFTLTWDPSDQADAAKYNVMYGTVSPLTTNLVSVLVPTTTATVTNNLVSGAEHYFIVTVVNQTGVESPAGVELRSTLLPVGPNDLKVIVKVQ